MEKNLKKIYISLTELLSCILKTNTTLLINYKKSERGSFSVVSNSLQPHGL